jgi:CheY-like chemotaxis protein
MTVWRDFDDQSSRRPAAPRSPRAGRAAPEGPCVAGTVFMPHVLLVSQDRDSCDLYKEWFTRTANLHTTCMSTISQATRVLGHHAADVVLIDVTTFEHWKDCASFGLLEGAPPVVVLTGWVAADGRFRRRAFDAGCAAFVAKPCHPRVLVTVLRRVLDGERFISMA